MNLLCCEVTMSIVEIRCPRCGSSSSLKDEKRHEYQCNHCKSTFVFVDTTKKEVIHDTRAHNCPNCGRPVKAGEGYICRDCEAEYLCENCIQVTKEQGFEKIICKKCVEEKGLSCSALSGSCKNINKLSCAVCGKQFCEEHYAVEFNAIISTKEMKRRTRETIKKGYSQHPFVFSLYCKHCGGYICLRCYTTRTSFWGGKEVYYCKGCGNKLEEWDKFGE